MAYRFRVSDDSSRNSGGRRSATMRKPEINKALTARAKELGVHFSERMLRDWSDEGLIRPAKRVRESRNEWTYQDDTIERGEIILGLKKETTRRADLLALYLWVAGHEIESDRIVCALSSEFSRTLQRVRRKTPPPCDIREGGEPNAWQQRQLEQENEKLDPDFRDLGISYEPDFLKTISSTIVWGNPEKQTDLKSLDLQMVLNFLFSGLFGIQDEIEGSFKESFDQISPQDIPSTRAIFESAISVFLYAPVIFQGFIPREIRDKIIQLGEKITQSLLSPEWLALALTVIAVNVARFRRLAHDHKCSTPDGR